MAMEPPLPRPRRCRPRRARMDGLKLSGTSTMCGGNHRETMKMVGKCWESMVGKWLKMMIYWDLWLIHDSVQLVNITTISPGFLVVIMVRWCCKQTHNSRAAHRMARKSTIIFYQLGLWRDITTMGVAPNNWDTTRILWPLHNVILLS